MAGHDSGIKRDDAVAWNGEIRVAMAAAVTARNVGDPKIELRLIDRNSSDLTQRVGHGIIIKCLVERAKNQVRSSSGTCAKTQVHFTPAADRGSEMIRLAVAGR